MDEIVVRLKSGISIHALLAESDHFLAGYTGRKNHFYPRSPCGERLDALRAEIRAEIFLSTLSLRRATFRCLPVRRGDPISIHALLAESDPQLWQCDRSKAISIHALLAESDEISVSPSNISQK